MADFAAIPADLEEEADYWDTESENLSSAGQSAGALTMTGWQGGLFFALIGDYNTGTEYISDLCRDGSAAFEDIGAALRINAGYYRQADADSVDELVSVPDGY